MADDTDDLVGRLDRIEELLRRRAGPAPAAPAGPEVRSARSIVSRIDDVWVAVTEGNERVVAAIADVNAVARPAPAAGGEAQNGAGDPQHDPAGAIATGSPAPELAGRLGGIERALTALAATQAAGERGLSARLAGIDRALTALAPPDEPDADDIGARLDRIEAALAGLAQPGSAAAEALAARLDGIDERLAALAGPEAPGNAVDERLRRIEELLATPGTAVAAADDPGVHLRLNRIEEALAGIAGRLADLRAGADPAGAGSDAAGAGAIEGLGAEVRRLAQQVEAMARAVEASAPRWGDGTVGDKLGRLRDQFRR